MFIELQIGITRLSVMMRLINNNILHLSAAVTKANSGRSSPAITDDWGTPAGGGKFTLLPGRLGGSLLQENSI